MSVATRSLAGPAPGASRRNAVTAPRPTPAARSRRVAADARRRSDPWFQYLLDFPGLEGVSVSERVPPDEYFSMTYITERIQATAAVVYNGVLSRLVLEVNNFADDDLDDLDDYVKWFPPFKFKLFGFIPLPIPLPDSSKFVQLPKLAAVYEDDVVFGEQRIAGVNPANVRGLDADDPRAAIVKGVAGATDAINAGKMFVLDYTGRPVGDGPADWIMPEKPIQGGEYMYKGQPYRKALPLPLAFFKWVDGKGQNGRGELLPVAIQLHENGRLYTPEDRKYDWLMAKIALSIADGNNHEMVSHLAKTHLFTEPFAVATRRCFNEDHPLSYLLRAHTRFMIANNRLARDKLVGVGGYVDRILAGTIQESVEMARVGVLNTDILKDNFKNDLIKRKVGPDRLPRYPYRDDGELLWEAIENFVTEYVNASYSTEKELQDDKELQLWCQELANPNQGAVNGMPSSVNSAADLVEILTSFIFISGPQHCAVNYTQHPMGSYVPNLPLNARDPYRQLSKRPASDPLNERDLLKMLPNQRCNRDQSEILYILSAYRFDALGEYDKAFESLYALTTDELLADHPQGPALKTAISNFQTALRDVEYKIQAANTASRAEYNYMAPSAVLNSISI